MPFFVEFKIIGFNGEYRNHSEPVLMRLYKGSLLWPGASHWRIYYHRIWVQLSTTCSNVLKQPNGELLVAVDHNQLRTMASETVDPTYWSHPPPSWAVPPESHVHSINQSNLSWTRTCNRSKRSNHLAYAATQGMIITICLLFNPNITCFLIAHSNKLKLVY